MAIQPPEIGIQTSAPSAMHRDLALKFGEDLRALLQRSLSIMGPSIGVSSTVDIVLSFLADAGLQIEEISECAPLTFESMVDTARECRRGLAIDRPAPSPFNLPCRFCGASAVGIYYFDKGCGCYPNDRLQALCAQHVDKATPIGGMRFIGRLGRRDES